MKYYVSVEIRHVFKDADGEINHKTITKTSVLFDNKSEAITFGNDIIVQNKWIVQYPGYEGQFLNEYSNLVMFVLKNHAQVFIKVCKFDELKLNDFNELLNIVK